MKNQTEIKLPVGVVETTNPEIDQRNNPDKMRDFSYKRISFSVGCSINGWYEMKLEIPVEIFDEAFYDSDADCPNREFMNIVNWKYSHKHGCHQYDAEIFCPTGHPSSDCTVCREIWLEYNGLEDKPMTWDEYVTQFSEFVFNASWEDVIVAIRHELKVRESVLTHYLNGDYEIWLQQEVSFNEWNTESLINEAVRIIDDIFKYVNHESKESVQTVDEGPITLFRGEMHMVFNKTKVMIATPMTGLSEKDVLDNINRIERKMTPVLCEHYNLDPSMIEFVHNFNADNEIGDTTNVKNIGLCYLGYGINKIMSNVDIVIFDKDYKKSKGCIVEHTVCEVYGIDIMHEDDYSD